MSLCFQNSPDKCDVMLNLLHSCSLEISYLHNFNFRFEFEIYVNVPYCFVHICIFYASEIINANFANINLLVVNYFITICKSRPLIPVKRSSNGYHYAP